MRPLASASSWNGPTRPRSWTSDSRVQRKWNRQSWVEGLMSETVRANAVTGSARLESTEGFPPQTTRQSELDAITEFYRGVIGSRRAVYVSAPITSGRRLIDWLAKN